MSWTDPPTFVAGDPLTAAELNTYLSDDLNYLKAIADSIAFSGTLVSRSAATAIANDTTSTITFSAETFDIGSWWSSGTDVIVPSGAIPAGFTTIAVLYVARTKFASNGTGRRQLIVNNNGTAVAGPTLGAINGDLTEIQAIGITTAAAADVFTVQVYQNSGASLNVSGTTFTIARYAPIS